MAERRIKPRTCILKPKLFLLYRHSKCSFLSGPQGLSPRRHLNTVEDATEVPCTHPLTPVRPPADTLLALWVSWPEVFSGLLTAWPDHRVSRKCQRMNAPEGPSTNVGWELVNKNPRSLACLTDYSEARCTVCRALL